MRSDLHFLQLCSQVKAEVNSVPTLNAKVGNSAILSTIIDAVAILGIDKPAVASSVV